LYLLPCALLSILKVNTIPVYAGLDIPKYMKFNKAYDPRTISTNHACKSIKTKEGDIKEMLVVALNGNKPEFSEHLHATLSGPDPLNHMGPLCHYEHDGTTLMAKALSIFER